MHRGLLLFTTISNPNNVGWSPGPSQVAFNSHSRLCHCEMKTMVKQFQFICQMKSNIPVTSVRDPAPAMPPSTSTRSPAPHQQSPWYWWPAPVTPTLKPLTPFTLCLASFDNGFAILRQQFRRFLALLSLRAWFPRSRPVLYRVLLFLRPCASVYSSHYS